MMLSQSSITFVGLAEQAVAAGDAGVVDQDRHRPDLFGDAPGDGVAVVAFDDVELEAFSSSAEIADLLCRRFGGFLVHVEQHHLRALTGIAERDGAADAGGGAGDDGDVVLEQRHGGFLVFLVLAFTAR